MDELISVIMPTYNRGYIISMAIDSILNQTYKNFELIIVDDFSNDDTAQIISKYKDKRIKYIKLDKKSGANLARNIGIENARGRFITFQDSDDYSYKERLKYEFKALKDENVDIVFSSFYKTSAGNEKIVINSCNKKIKKILFPNEKIENDQIFNTLLYRNVITTQVLFGKREVFDKEKFDDSITRFQDWDLMIRIARNYKVFHLEQPLLYMFVQNDSISKSPKKGYESLEIIYKKYYSLFNNEQKCRILFRIGTFKMMDNIDATEDFKKGLSLYKNIEYITIYFLYKIKLYKIIYTKIKK